MKIQMPDNVRFILNKLEENNFDAYIVGGCVRDSLIGKTPNDWDICTNALPQDILRVFDGFNTFDAGIKHGTVSLVLEKEVYEITTFRIDGEYSDNRHPESVEFTDDIVKDLSRRDFTVNALAYNEKKGLVDPFGGVEDLKFKAIRCVGEPVKRFEEDALRVMRALRFAAVYDMPIEKETARAIFKSAPLLHNIAVERITEEFNKLVCGVNCEYILRRFRDVFTEFIPEIKVMFDYDQNTKHHNKTLWRHTTCSMSLVEPEPILRITMLFHDLGKPMACTIDDEGVSHFKGHPKFSAAMAETILNRLKYPKNFIDTCVTLILFHDVRFSDNKKQIKRMMNRIGVENMHLLFKVQYADFMAQSMYKREEKLYKYQLATSAFKEILEKQECFTLKQLNVNGHDLIHIGINDGKKIGEILKSLLSDVIDGKIENEKQLLLSEAERLKDKL